MNVPSVQSWTNPDGSSVQPDIVYHPDQNLLVFAGDADQLPDSQDPSKVVRVVRTYFFSLLLYLGLTKVHTDPLHNRLEKLSNYGRPFLCSAHVLAGSFCVSTLGSITIQHIPFYHVIELMDQVWTVGVFVQKPFSPPAIRDVYTVLVCVAREELHRSSFLIASDGLHFPLALSWQVIRVCVFFLNRWRLNYLIWAVPFWISRNFNSLQASTKRKQKYSERCHVFTI